ncbi:MAG: site-specific integrase [Candidatus Shapirobacteria bacterium]
MVSLKSVSRSFEIYLKDTKGLTPLTIKNYRADLRDFCSFLTQNQHIDLRLVTPSVLESYRIYLLANKLAKSTINRRLATVRTFCQFSYDQGWLEQNPASSINNLSVNRTKEKEIHDLVSKFGGYLKKSRASKNTIKNYTADIRKYLMQNSKFE